MTGDSNQHGLKQTSAGHGNPWPGGFGMRMDTTGGRTCDHLTPSLKGGMRGVRQSPLLPLWHNGLGCVRTVTDEDGNWRSNWRNGGTNGGTGQLYGCR